MTLRPQALPPVPEATEAVVQAAFPKGNLYVALRTEFGALYGDQLFVDLYPPAGRPVEVASWRLALVVVMQYADRWCLLNSGQYDRWGAEAGVPGTWDAGSSDRRTLDTRVILS